MKINWFSPLPPDHTEIANYTARLLPALERKFDTTVWTATNKWNGELNEICRINRFSEKSIDWKTINLGGFPIYHIGNNIHFHGDIIKAARACPGIVVVHDLSVHETVMNLCLYRGHGRAEYFDILYRFGGSKAVDMGKQFLDDQSIDTNTLSEKYPLFEYVLRNARGVITHNPLNARVIRGFSPAPVLYAPLPYVRRTDILPPVVRTEKSETPYQLVLFGYLGSSNRRLKPFLEAFKECKSRNRFKIVIAGKYREKEVGQWIQDLSLGKHVKPMGFLPEDDLEILLHESDLCINLRWPSRGESSATLLRIWNHSLPSLVTNTDYYSTVPKDAVSMVDPYNEKADIISHLEAFALNPEPYYQKGLAAREHLEREHSTDAFAGFLGDFLPTVEAARGLPQPQAFGKTLARDYFSNYPDPSARDELAKVCAKEVALWSS